MSQSLDADPSASLLRASLLRPSPTPAVPFAQEGEYEECAGMRCNEHADTVSLTIIPILRFNRLLHVNVIDIVNEIMVEIVFRVLRFDCTSIVDAQLISHMKRFTLISHFRV